MPRKPRPEVARSRGRLAALTRHRAADDPAVIGAARDLAAARVDDHLRAAVAASRAAQGLPPTVTDPATLERVAAVLRLVALNEPAVPPQRRRQPAKVPGVAT